MVVRGTMPRMSQYLSFLAVASMAMVVPGPDTFVVLRTSLAGGARAGVWAAAGSAAGLLLWGTATVVGLTTLLTASAPAFGAVKLAGAGYLAFLGIQALRADPTDAGRVPRGGAFRRGLLSDLANAKVALFWIALAPQFLDGGSGAAMVVTASALAFAWLSGYALLAGRIRFGARGINRAAGVAMVALAVWLVL
jgi:threonine/homoserine/homoserine lactone efflux protein